MRPSSLIRVLLFVLGSGAAGAFDVVQVAPVATNPELGAEDDDHWVFVPEPGKATGYLLLFYPGTGAAPSDYVRFCETAAAMGHHVIGLSYPNDESINMVLCRNAPSDECFRQARMEIHTGEDLHDDVTVDADDSIEGRLEALLGYLAAADPEAGWDRFVDAGGAPDWSRFLVAGQSQGGGHAGFTAKRHAVARCIQFSATDWWRGGPAAWIAEPGATPPDRFYGFTHLLDEAVPPDLQSPTWVAYGMTDDGGERVVDDATAPYRQSRRLYFAAPIAFDGDPEDNYHNALSVDAALELDGGGEPVVRPVWEYLLAMPAAEADYDLGGLEAFHEQLAEDFLEPFAFYLYEGDERIYAFEDGIDEFTVLPMASASKWFAGAIMLAVAEAGYFSLDDPISLYVDDFDRPDKEGITIRQAFGMTAGMVPANARENTLQWNPSFNHEESVSEIAEVAVSDTPGEVIYYWGGGMQAAGLAAVRATGLPDWEAVARNFLFEPLGMTGSSFSNFLPNPAVAGGVVTTGAEYLRFLGMLAANGLGPDGELVFGTASLAPFYSGEGRDKPIAKSPFFEESPHYPYGRSPYYSFGAWVLADDPARFGVEEVTSPGAYGTYPWIDRKRGLHAIFLTEVPAGSSLAQEPALRSFAEIRQAYDAARPERVPALPIGEPDSGWIDPEVNPVGNEMAFQTSDGRIWLGLLDEKSGGLIPGSLETAATEATPLLISWNGPEFAVDDSGWSLIYNRRIGGSPNLWEARPTREGWETAPIFADNSVTRSTFQTSQGPDLTEKWVMYILEDGTEPMLTAASLSNPANEIPLVPFGPREPSHARFITNEAAVLFATGPDVAEGELYHFELPSGQRTTIYASDEDLGLPVAMHAPEAGGALVVGVVEDGRLFRFFQREEGGNWSEAGEMGLPEEAVEDGYTVASSPEAFVFGGRSFICLNIERPGTGIGAVEEAQIWLLSPGWNGFDPIDLRCDDGVDPALRTDPEFYLTENEVFTIYNKVSEEFVYSIERARSGLGSLLSAPSPLSISAARGFLELNWADGGTGILEQSSTLRSDDWHTVHSGPGPFLVPLRPDPPESLFWRRRSDSRF
ncbi:MAG: serine hydrolase domain-containing protein [Puniceicoccaceae bacterium]